MAGVIFVTGTLLGLEQMGIFFLLEGRVSSSIVTYLAVTLAWLCGTLVGLRWPAGGRLDPGRPLVAGLVGYYAILILVTVTPYDLRWLAAYGPLTAMVGYFAGYFFRALVRRTDDPQRLFLFENNGFIVGLIATAIGVMVFGVRFALLAPALVGGLLVIWGWPPSIAAPVRSSAPPPP